MRLYKAHGLGNDYLVLEGGSLDPARARALCDRYRGPGSDGVLQVVTSTRADVGVRIWNPDGSLAEKSGNGLRILAWYLHHRRGAASELTVEVGGEVVACVVDGAVVEVEMGKGVVDAPAPIGVDDVALSVLRVSVGNPHCVVFRDEPDLDALPWRRWGEVLERHPLFPNRTNVQVARQVSDAAFEARIWERGAGPTLASGSSACAIAAAAVWSGRSGPGRLTVHMPGGSLEVTVRADATLRLRGPVEGVGWFELEG